MIPTQTPSQYELQPGAYGQPAQWEAGQAEFLQRVMANFGVTLLIAGGSAAAAAMFLPPAAYLGLIILQLILLVVMVFARRAMDVNPALLYAFAAVSGAATVPVMWWAMNQTGSSAVVYNALAVTGAIFCGMAWYGHSTKKDLSSWSTFLMMGLLGTVVASLVGIFITHSTVTQLMLSGAIVIVFAGFTAYDLNQMKTHWREYSVNLATLNLYLDFLNLFVAILRILGIVGGRDD